MTDQTYRDAEEYLGIKAQMQEIRTLQRRREELQQQIGQKQQERRYETEVDTVYYDRRNLSPRVEGRPVELKNLSESGRYDFLQKVLRHEEKPHHKVEGTIGRKSYSGRSGPYFSVPEGASLLSLPSLSPPVMKLLEDTLSHEYYTWSVINNKFRLEDYGTSTHFDLIWPKGDGSRYDIFDVSFFPDVQQTVNTIKYLGNWAYGSLETAYRTKSNLIVLKFNFRAD